MKSQGPNKTPNSDNSTGLGLDQLPEKLDAQTALLARQLAPILLCDKNEPFKPVAVGITHLRPGQPSPSFGHINPATQAPTGTDSILEYEIWWDGDIQHLYELEHVWIYLDENNAAIHVTASAHGKMLDMSQSIWQDRQVRLFCEPGKHAHSPTSAQVIERREALDKACSDLEGVGDILVQPFFAQQLAFLCPYDHYLAFDHLRNLRFKPTYSFEKSFDLSPSSLHELA
ncbi:hypothetical protein [uncultured Cohaesibacter sp.]|uniref:hypothetical protein n=1 Tax=uncultured Cohaesibacter sp. TaxID=1002546 RepID=UPI00292F63D0|nr:hypothetical protein [uncultured Cohaesibacter sp.]